MEHRLILGGEQYLPFARSRIRALRAAGMRFASQQFVMPDGEVHVRIIGSQEYIRLLGSGYDILSGVTHPGDIVSGDPDVLQSFKPTTETVQFILGNPTVNTPFHDEKRLAISAHADLGVSGSQYKEICPSMYSGTMTKLVQCILGLGKNKKTPDGVQLRYDYRWAKCHGVLTDAEDLKWLIQISADGIYAMRVPVYPGSASAISSRQKAVREAVALFGGVPSGEAFPAGTALTAAIAAGTVKELASATDVAAVFAKSSYSTAMGWSFNNAGTEAHNTCYSESAGVYTSYHYKLDISLTGATLTLVTSGVVKGGGRFKFWEPTTSNYLRVPNNTWSSGGAELTKVPVFVCHIDGVLEIVSHCMRHTAGGATDEYGPGTKFMNDTRPGPGYAVNPYTASWRLETGAYAYSTYAESTTIPGTGSAGIAYTVWSNLSTYGTFTFGGNSYDCPAYTTVRTVTTNAESVGCTLNGTRDGFCLRAVSKTLEVATTRNVYESDVVTFGGPFAAGVWQAYVSGSPAGPPVSDYLYGLCVANTTPAYVATTSSSVTAPKIDTLSSLSDGRGQIDSTETFATSGDQTTADGVWKSTSGSFHLRASKLGTNREIIFSVKHTDGAAVNSDGALLGYSGYASPYASFVGYI